jgi:hypothetical protein
VRVGGEDVRVDVRSGLTAVCLSLSLALSLSRSLSLSLSLFLSLSLSLSGGQGFGHEFRCYWTRLSGLCSLTVFLPE